MRYDICQNAYLDGGICLPLQLSLHHMQLLKMSVAARAACFKFLWQVEVCLLLNQLAC